MQPVPNIEALLRRTSEERATHPIVYVNGYYREGDGGAQLVQWKPDSIRTPNGGTVHEPLDAGGRPGRWEQLHHGVGDFRTFGVLDASQPADAALEAMLLDPEIHAIEAHSDLNFIRRHLIGRSDIVLDFHNHTVTTEGIELNTRDNPFGAVLCFRGTPAGVTQSVVVSAELKELTDILEVADASAFQVEDWWIARVDPHPEGRAQRELDYLLRVTEILDATHVRVGYKLGWPIAAGRQITYTKMNPVFRCHVRNMRFRGVPVPPSTSTTARPFETWDQIGSNPVAYEFAVECDVSGIYATRVFWPVIQRRYCSHYVTERCELINPVERDWGGTGYLTQQLNVLYGHVRDCNTSNSRHLNDFTCAGYCMVENCHADGDEYGPFVTHGQFEHDLVFTGNSGLLSFANSGMTWGNSAKRITVRKHVACRVVAHKWLTDLTLEDVHAIRVEGIVDSGSIWANVDGLQMRGCTAEAMLTLSQGSSHSKRPNIIEGCSFGMMEGGELARPVREGNTDPGSQPVYGDLLIQNSRFYHVERIELGSINQLTLVNTRFQGAGTDSGLVRTAVRELVIQGGGFENCGLQLVGAWQRHTPEGSPNQSVRIDSGTEFLGTNGQKAFLKSDDPANRVVWSFGSITSSAADEATAHFHLEGGSHQLKAVGAVFRGGRFDASQAGFGQSSDRFLFLASCIEEGVDRTALPADDGGRISTVSGNLML